MHMINTADAVHSVTEHPDSDISKCFNSYLIQDYNTT